MSHQRAYQTKKRLLVLAVSVLTILIVGLWTLQMRTVLRNAQQKTVTADLIAQIRDDYDAIVRTNTLTEGEEPVSDSEPDPVDIEALRATLASSLTIPRLQASSTQADDDTTTSTLPATPQDE